MNKETRTALEESIEKWKQIERGEMPDLGPENCGLCVEFHDRSCEGCPVFEATGIAGCGGTPYVEWDNAMIDLNHIRFVTWAVDRVADTPKLVKLARAEREFLESLRPHKQPQR